MVNERSSFDYARIDEWNGWDTFTRLGGLMDGTFCLVRGQSQDLVKVFSYLMFTHCYLFVFSLYSSPLFGYNLFFRRKIFPRSGCMDPSEDYTKLCVTLTGSLPSNKVQDYLLRHPNHIVHRQRNPVERPAGGSFGQWYDASATLQG